MITIEPAFALLTPLLGLAAGGGEFPAIVWRLDHPYGPIDSRLVEAFGGVNVEGTAEARWAREAGLEYYVGHAPGRNDLHLERESGWYGELWARYWEERDASILIREPCLSEEKTFTRLEARLHRTLSAREGEHGLGISLGDEVGLTAFGAPLDLCGSEACRDAYRTFLSEREEWAWLVAGEDLPPFPDTDTTRRAWTEGNPEHVGAWLARRCFHRQVLIRFLARLAASAKGRSPETPVGLFGINGRTAFGGVGADAILPHLDFIETYPTLDSRELLYTVRKRGVRSFATVFREPDSPSAAAWRVWEHWLRGGDGVILWCDRDLAQHDDYFEATKRAVEDVRGLRARFPDWAPSPAGVAVIHHPDSIALSWLRDALIDGPTWPKRFPSYQNEHGMREVALRACLRWLEDGGLLPGALPLERIGAETVARFPYLIASELIVVESGELEALAAYLEAGGTLLLHGSFATYDRRGVPSKRDAREVLKERGGERVLELELEPSRYLRERRRTGSSYATDRIGFLRGLVGEDHRPTWKPRAKGDDPRWLVARVPHPEKAGWLHAAIPNLQDVEHRKTLRPLEVEITGIEPGRIEWIHPASPAGRMVELPAGEALVFFIPAP